MIEVEIVLPDKTRRRGRIDPSASIEKIKADIVKGVGLNDPDDYDLAISPKSKKVAWQNYGPSAGDIFILTNAGDVSGSAFELTD